METDVKSKAEALGEEIATLSRAESGRAYALLKSYVGEPEDEVWWSLLSKLKVAAGFGDASSSPRRSA